MDKVKVGTSQFIRDLNLTGIFKLIHKYGPISRKELAENTGYSAATISNHVRRLLERDFVRETEKGSSTGGRKPVFLTVNPDRGYMAAVDIEVKKVKVTVFNLMLEIVGTKTFPTIDRGPTLIFSQIVRELNRLVDELNISRDKIMGMGIAVPGLVDIKPGILKFAPNLGWQEISVINYFKDYFSFPVLLENEANAAVIGERIFKFPDIDNQVFISINQGIGCGIIFNGKLYRGASGNAGEFGHIIIDSDGPECHCGNHGCWETLASLNYITEGYYNEKGHHINIESIRDKIKNGDKVLLSLLKETGQNIGIGLVNIINSLSPELLIIGGDILYLSNYMDQEIRSVLAEEALKVSYQNVEVVYSELGNQASLFGLASLVFDNIIKQEFK